MLTGGAYSEKFKELSKDCNNELFSTPHHAQQLAARDRARKLSLETNRRRRALEIKKRLEAQKEARRREEVLKERSQRQQEATQKFQHRTKRASPARTPSDRNTGKSYHHHHGHHNSQRKADSANGHGSRGQSSQSGTPNLEDALRLVGGHNSQGSYGSYTAPAGYSSGSGNVVYQHDYSQSDNSLHRKYGMDSNANHVQSSSNSGYHGYTTSATATYLAPSSGSSAHPSTSSSNSVRLIQQSLHEQQKKFVEEQTKSLQEFNDAIMQEATPAENVLERSDSLSSVDSLEEQPKAAAAPVKTEVNMNKYSLASKPPSVPAVTVGYYTNGQFNPPLSVARVQPQQKAPPVNKTETDSTGKFFVSNHRRLDRDSGYSQQNGELKVEDTSETDIVSEVVEDRPVLLQGSMQLHTRQNVPRSSYADTVSHYVGRKSDAWATPSPSESSSEAAHQHVVAAGYAVNSNGTSRGNSARSRQLSAKTLSTTAFTAVPISNNIDHNAQQQPVMSSPNRTAIKESAFEDRGKDRGGVRFDETPSNTPNRTKESAVNSGVKERSGVRFDNTTPTSDKPPKAASVKKKISQPISILKKTNSEQPAKLGGFKVRDSLEISKSSPVGQKSGKKSVRWGDDIEYTLEEPADYHQVESVKVQNGKDNGDEDVPKDNDVNDAAAAPSQRQQKRPMSAAAGGRDSNRGNSSTGQRASQKNKQNIYDNTSYAAGLAAARSKQQPETPVAAATTSSSVHPTPVSATKNGLKKLPPSGKASSNTSVSIKNTPVRGPNGLRLDKTPTDDEINWLWDKVRTCLNSTDGQIVTQRPPSGQQSSRQPSSTESSPRQLASMTSQCIDGGRITANLRIPQDRASSAVASSRGNGVPRWRTNSDSGTYLRRTALLHQRRQHSAITRGQGGGGGGSNTRQGSAHHQPVPSTSHQGPSRTVTAPPQEDEVSDSLMAFQRAEQLAMNENTSEAELAGAMDNQRTTGKPEKVPSALSMEENRIMESLDRLNERLRTVTSETSTPYMGITPKPPPFGGGFRGHRPMSSRPGQHVMPADLVTMPLSSHVRASSADRSNVRINAYR